MSYNIKLNRSKALALHRLRLRKSRASTGKIVLNSLTIIKHGACVGSKRCKYCRVPQFVTNYTNIVRLCNRNSKLRNITSDSYIVEEIASNLTHINTSVGAIVFNGWVEGLLVDYTVTKPLVEIVL